jgi:hypothetical protein
MIDEAKAAGTYTHAIMGRTYDVIRIVTIQEIIEQGTRLDMPMSWEVIKKGKAHVAAEQTSFDQITSIMGTEEDE